MSAYIKGHVMSKVATSQCLRVSMIHECMTASIATVEELATFRRAAIVFPVYTALTTLDHPIPLFL
jgi:hypothetical protein